MLEPLAPSHHYITNATGDFYFSTRTPMALIHRISSWSGIPLFQVINNLSKSSARLLGSTITDLSSRLENKSYYVRDDPNFPMFDAFIIELDRTKKSAILWVLQMTTSRKHGGSAKGYQKICEIIAILKNELREVPPLKKSKTATGQAAPLVQVRCLLVVPKDEPQS